MNICLKTVHVQLVGHSPKTENVKQWCHLEMFRANAIIDEQENCSTEDHENCKGWDLSTLWTARAHILLSFPMV